MSWVATAVVGTTVVSNYMSGRAQANAANTAANAQVQAAQLGIEEQRRQFDQVRALLQPYVSAGNTGLAAQLDLMGLGGGYWIDANGQRVQDPSNRVSLSSGRGGSIWGQREIDRTGQTFVSAQDAQQRAIDGIKNGAAYQSAMQAGTDSILSTASATGGLRGGNAQAALGQFGQQLLTQSINDRLSQLGGLSAMGQNSAAGVGSAGMASGNAVSQLLQQQGSANAGAALAAGRATANTWAGLGQGVGMWAGMTGLTPPPNVTTTHTFGTL